MLTPLQHRLNPIGSIDFGILDTELEEVWGKVVRNCGRELGRDVAVQPVAFSFDWYNIRFRIVEGLRHTAHWRYVRCYGPAIYQAIKREMEEGDVAAMDSDNPEERPYKRKRH